jgi:hypothetical protein
MCLGEPHRGGHDILIFSRACVAHEAARRSRGTLLPRRDLPEHKIQSDPAFSGKDADATPGLTLALRPVPKFLGADRQCKQRPVRGVHRLMLSHARRTQASCGRAGLLPPLSSRSSWRPMMPYCG